MHDAQFSFVTIYKVGKCIMPSVLKTCSDFKSRVVYSSLNAGYTPQDNRADLGPISPLLTILGNVLIILVDLKIIFSDSSVV